MAQLLNADNILPEQAINTLGIHIRGFQAGTKVCTQKQKL